MTKGFTRGLAAACMLAPLGARAQTATTLAVLKGLAPLTTLSKTAAGRARTTSIASISTMRRRRSPA